MCKIIKYIVTNSPNQIKYCLDTLKSWNNKRVSFLNTQHKNVSLISYLAVASFVYTATCHLCGSEEPKFELTWKDGVRVMGHSAAIGIGLWGTLNWLDAK